MKRIGVMVLVMVALAAQAAVTTTWDGTTGAWSDNVRWDQGVPGNGDTAVINGGTVTLGQPTEALAALTMNGGTLVFTNWTTKLTAATVTINSGGTVTHAVHSDTNGADGWSLESRVWVDCTALSVLGTGKIDVKGRGYLGGVISFQPGYGPGGGSGAYGGGTHGGYGGNSFSAIYGDIASPTNPGSGGAGPVSGTLAGKGGGVVRIAATGTVTVNGNISADGEQGIGYAGSGGSGGSIWITCGHIVGSGTVIAAGGNGYIHASAGSGGGGGGGRIAVDYNESAQQQAGVPGIVFSVAGGNPGNPVFSWYGWQNGDLGTLWFPDNQFLTGHLRHKGQWLSPAAAGEWALDSLVISNGWLRFPASGGVLTVANDVLVTGAGAGLDLGGNSIRAIPFVGENRRPINYLFSDPASHELRVGGDLTLTNSASMRVYSGVTNGVVDHGVLVSVAGAFSLANGCAISLFSHWTNGGAPRLEMWELNLASNATINANGGGFGGGERFGPAGYGPGAANRTGTVITGAGAGHGGIGGSSQHNTSGGPAYGNANAPALPGSGGDPGDTSPTGGMGGYGGGSIRLAVRQTANVNGTISANGQNGIRRYGGGGSGGGIWITCNRFQGSGAMTANGGDGSEGLDGQAGSGGGGRIAVWQGVPESQAAAILAGDLKGALISTNLTTFTGSTSVDPGIARTYSPQATKGTVVFLTAKIPPKTIIVVR